ncbi:MAG: DUF1156 domain-containing protein [Chloroflexi bacterium]|nr:DUF1156 domain-containing protein [Chloroflexota bacterium]
MKIRKKLIEVALPLDAINKASAREKSIRHGHPSTLHLWWARRPLAAARAVIFAQMVDDPAANPDLFSTEREQEKERKRLFRIIEDLVQWENTTNEELLKRARAEIWQSWRRACADNANHPRFKELFDRHVLPAFHDPFAGGGSLPLEAQRLGLQANASDLNPVAVLINKAMIEIPPKFAGHPPVNPEVRRAEKLMGESWYGALGLVEDVRFYGRWMREKAKKHIGHLYPKVRVTAEMAKDRPDLATYVGRELTVIAWIWARTVNSPNPAFANVEVPLASSFILSRKAGRGAYVEPIVEDRYYQFSVKAGPPTEAAKSGTKLGRGANFRCILSHSPISGDYIKAEGQAGRMKARLMAIVAEGDRGRVYLPPTAEHESRPIGAQPRWRPETSLPDDRRAFWTPNYGLTSFGDLFSNRQLVALTTLSHLVSEARKLIREHATSCGIGVDDGLQFNDGTSRLDYAEAVSVYLALAVSKTADSCCTVARWQSTGDFVAGAFARQGIPMVWDFAETNIFSSSTQNWSAQIEWVAKALQNLPTQKRRGQAFQADAASKSTVSTKNGVGQVARIVSTDPPYYDNVGYADLSDFFYPWLRCTLSTIFPELFATVAVPKREELIASPYRHGDRQHAEAFFLDGMTQAMTQLARQPSLDFPVTIFYAFKQSEMSGNGSNSSGWETFLDAAIQAGFGITATWPLRTERRGRPLAIGTNALASSIVLACRPRAENAPTVTRREFQDALRAQFPIAIDTLRRSNIAPVDLAQASIGPGMAIFTGYSRVLNADGSPLSVGDALALINEMLDEVLADQEGELDSDTRWALTWFEQYVFAEGEYGAAETLSKAKNTSVEGLVRAGIIESRRGTVRILRPSELDADWDPTSDARLTVWEMTQYLIRAIASGEKAAAAVAAKLGSRAEAARDLAYRLYLISERKRRATDALQYNSLVQSWPEIARLARERPALQQESMLG